MKSVLLIGKKGFVIDEAKKKMNFPDIKLYTSTTVDEVQSAFKQGEIDHVIMGAGIELTVRLEIIQTIFQLSDSTTIHMKDIASGPQGFFPFANAILTGLRPLS